MEVWHSRTAPDEEFEFPALGLRDCRAPMVSIVLRPFIRQRLFGSAARGEIQSVPEGKKKQHPIPAGPAGHITNVEARVGERVEAEALLSDIQPARVVLRRKNR
jgi:biotin carboxyl carrier protein